jgi:competence protein ComEA
MGDDKMIKLKKREEKAVIAIIIAVFGIFVICRFIVFKPNSVEIIKGDSQTEEMDPVKKTEDIYVYITGEVQNPGLYIMKKDERINDVIDKAGGFTVNADITSVNPAEKLIDEQYITVAARGTNTDNQSSGSSISRGKININTATAEELDSFLPGIGETYARNIVEYRTQNGRFKTIDDITKVEGIGKGKRFESIKDKITVY